jgi:uncharacterized protein YdaU (DUF1376 family)
MYSRGGAIPDDEAWIARACGCHVRSWRALRQRLIDAGKLILADGFLSNLRTLREIERAQGRLTASREAAEASARARRERAENEAQSNDYRDIPEATAQNPDELSPTNNYQPSYLSAENHTVTPAGAAADAASGPPAADVTAIIFSQGLDWLKSATKKPEGTCRALLGKWRKDFGSDEALISTIGAAQRHGPIDPVPWMEGAIKARNASAAPKAKTWAEQLP